MNILNKIKEYIIKYKHYIIYGVLGIVLLSLWGKGCKTNIKDLLFKPNTEKIDSINTKIELIEEQIDTLQELINQKKQEAKYTASKIPKVDINKLKKDEESIKKYIYSDSLSIPERTSYWTNEFK